MNNWYKGIVSISLIGVLGFFITSGSYMNQVSSNTSKIEEVTQEVKATNRISKLALDRSKEALKQSEESIESDRKTEEMVKSFHEALNEIKTGIAVRNNQDRHTQKAIDRIEKMLIKHVQASE